MNPTDGISGHWWGSVGWPTAHLLRPGVTPATTLCGRRVPGPLMSGETAALRRCGQCARRTLTDTRPPRDPEAVAALADLIHAAITDAGVDCPDLPDTHADDRGVCWTVAEAVQIRGLSDRRLESGEMGDDERRKDRMSAPAEGGDAGTDAGTQGDAQSAEQAVRSARYAVTFDDLFHVPKGWLSWRCLLGWSTLAPGYMDGACQYDHNVDSWEQLAAEAHAHLARWHPHVAALAERDTENDRLRDVRMSEIEPGQEWLFDGAWVEVIGVESSPHPDDRVTVVYLLDGERCEHGGYLGWQRAAVRPREPAVERAAAELRRALPGWSDERPERAALAARPDTAAPEATDEHIYLSTACLHHDHGYCGSSDGYDVQGEPFEKRPAQCKWCASPCICDCHVDSAALAARTPQPTPGLPGADHWHAACTSGRGDPDCAWCNEPDPDGEETR